MNPYRVRVCMDRFSDGLSIRSNGPNTLTCQSSGTNNDPSDPLLVDVTTPLVLKRDTALRNHMTYINIQ